MFDFLNKCSEIVLDNDFEQPVFIISPYRAYQLLSELLSVVVCCLFHYFLFKKERKKKEQQKLRNKTNKKKQKEKDFLFIFTSCLLFNPLIGSYVTINVRMLTEWFITGRIVKTVFFAGSYFVIELMDLETIG